VKKIHGPWLNPIRSFFVAGQNPMFGGKIPIKSTFFVVKTHDLFTSPFFGWPSPRRRGGSFLGDTELLVALFFIQGILGG